MSELYLNEEKDYSEENKVAMKAFTPPFINHFSLSLKRKKCVTIRAMRKMTEVVIHRYSSKYLYWILFLIKLQAFRSASLLGRDANKDVFL